MEEMKNKIIFICYDISLRNYFTSKNIKWLLTGLNQTSKKSFWIYDNTDESVRSIVEQWKNKTIEFNT